MLVALVVTCTTTADRLESRAEIFGSKEGLDYFSRTGNKVFIIHGHDEAKRRELESLLEEFKLETLVLEEHPGAGETLIQKCETVADDCCYAFALLTPDDSVKTETGRLVQPRPNVLFELGWFYGRFGRKRVCILKMAGTGIPSDLAGILSIGFNTNVGQGYMKIRAELQKLGIIAEVT